MRIRILVLSSGDKIIACFSFVSFQWKETKKVINKRKKIVERIEYEAQKWYKFVDFVVFF